MQRGKFAGSSRMKLAPSGTHEDFQSLNRQIAQSSIRAAPTSRRHREKWGTRIASRGGALLERLHGCGFVVFHVEYGIELGDLQQIVDFLGELEQLQFAALVLGGGEGANQFADT